MLKRLLTLTVFLLIVAAIFFISPVRFPIRQLYPIRGIDVSHHQKTINWKILPDQHVDFAWIKASEGGDFRDSLFQRNWKAAKAAGIPRGAYHFLTFCRSGRVQARNFIQAVGSFDSTDLIPVIDIEYDGNCKRRLSQTEMETLIEEFTAELKKHSKNPPILYVTRELYRDYFLNNSKHRFWVRAIIASPTRIYGPNWEIWQYNHRGRIKGVTGPVDFNVLKNGSLEPFYNR